MTSEGQVGVIVDLYMRDRGQADQGWELLIGQNKKPGIATHELKKKTKLPEALRIRILWWIPKIRISCLGATAESVGVEHFAAARHCPNGCCEGRNAALPRDKNPKFMFFILKFHPPRVSVCLRMITLYWLNFSFFHPFNASKSFHKPVKTLSLCVWCQHSRTIWGCIHQVWLVGPSAFGNGARNRVVIAH